MRHFDVRKQLNGESLAVFEQGLRTLHGEAWPGVDLKSPDADSRLRRKFVDGLMDGQIQTYLRLHATSYDFPTTVAKARQYEDADKLYRTAKKPAIRTASVSDYLLDTTTHAILDGVKAYLLGDRGREAEVNTAQVPNFNANAGSKSKRATFRQGSPAPSNASAGSSASRVSSNGRTVRFQDQVTTPMVLLAAAGGQVTSHHDRAMAMAPGRGKIRDSNQDEGPLHLGPHYRATNGRQDNAADAGLRITDVPSLLVFHHPLTLSL